MKWVEITVTTAPSAVEAIANILLECRTGGIVEEHPEPGTVQLRGYLPVGPATDVTLAAIERRLHALPGFGLDIGVGRLTTSFVEDSGWANAWKNHFKPFAVGGRLWITPTWDRTAPPRGSIIIELDPGMAFGSGLHPSTQMCLVVLENLVRGGERVIDVGTGSGILSIACARLGAAAVLAVDVDPVAVDVATQNIAHNQVDDRVQVRQGSLLDGVAGPADLIVANLTADILLDLIPAAPPRLHRSGVLVASGIVADRLLEVEAVARSVGFRTVESKRDAEWRCVILSPNSSPWTPDPGS